MSEEQRLRKVIDDAVAMLGAWLHDNTNEVFEEQPEIDAIRTFLNDAIEGSSIP